MRNNDLKMTAGKYYFTTHHIQVPYFCFDAAKIVSWGIQGLTQLPEMYLWNVCSVMMQYEYPLLQIYFLLLVLSD